MPFGIPDRNHFRYRGTPEGVVVGIESGRVVSLFLRHNSYQGQPRSYAGFLWRDRYLNNRGAVFGFFGWIKRYVESDNRLQARKPPVRRCSLRKQPVRERPFQQHSQVEHLVGQINLVGKQIAWIRTKLCGGGGENGKCSRAGSLGCVGGSRTGSTRSGPASRPRDGCGKGSSPWSRLTDITGDRR